MYRFLFRTVYTARNSSFSAHESCVLLAKHCDKAAAPVFRVANGGGVKALSTSSVRLCEKKNNVSSSNRDEKTNADKEVDPTETLVTQKAEDASKVIKMAEQSEEPKVSKTDDGRTTKQQMDVKTEQVVATPKQERTDVAKSGKESLLDLLGAMKVEVTNKRKLKNLKAKQNFESTPEPKPVMENTISMFQQASTQSETLDPDLVAAASAAASTLPNHSQAESELLRQLRQHEAITEAQKKGDMKLRVIIADMKVGKNPNRQNTRPANQIRFDDDGRGYTHDRGVTGELAGIRKRRTLFSGKRLNIFSPTTDEDRVESTVGSKIDVAQQKMPALCYSFVPPHHVHATSVQVMRETRPTLWDMNFACQLSQSINQLPRNRFEEMIQWTKEGKMWQYPINNEAGLEEEASVMFHEHVFLEKHLEESFPRQGPVRHFMELVVAGLSRNPYLTVQQKKEHIFWFQDYFHQKEELLKEADVYLN